MESLSQADAALDPACGEEIKRVIQMHAATLAADTIHDNCTCFQTFDLPADTSLATSFALTVVVLA
eukprot:5538789-Amphidinium_carterae.2